jgi:hypothetical protein
MEETKNIFRLLSQNKIEVPTSNCLFLMIFLFHKTNIINSVIIQENQKMIMAN